MDRRLARTLLVVLLAVVPLGVAGVATAQDEPPMPDPMAIYDLERPLSECIGLLQQPGCGREPTDAGDRGGSLQYATFAVILAGLGIIFTIVFRNVIRSDRDKAQRAYAAEATAGSAPDTPSGVTGGPDTTPSTR